MALGRVHDQVGMTTPGRLQHGSLSLERDDSPHAPSLLMLSRTAFPGIPGRSGPDDPPVHQPGLHQLPRVQPPQLHSHHGPLPAAFSQTW